MSEISLRNYQIPLWKAFEEQGYKKLLCVWPRRAGKDFVAWSLLYRAAMREVGVYIYCLPTAQQARLVIWESITGELKKFPDMIAPDLIEKKNESEMKIVLRNGSIIRLVGSDNYDRSIVGGNAKMFVFSEYALADAQAYHLGAKPILDQNGGSVIFISTPRSKNHFYDLYTIAKNSPDWFCQKLTVEDTKHISVEQIRKDIANGEISESLADQEFFTSFDKGQDGTVYGKIIDRIRTEGHITRVSPDPNLRVHTAWDLGVADSTSIVFFTVKGNEIFVLDYYENSGKGLDFYAKYIASKEWLYGQHIAPADIAVREFTSGVSRIEAARSLGINFTIAPKLRLEDGIEATRAALARMWFNEATTKQLVKSLENYHYEFDEKYNIYSNTPVHDSFSHACFIGNTLIKTKNGDKEIQDIVVGDYVITPTGLKRVLVKHKLKTKILCEISIDSKKIVCTPDHKFFTQRGLVRADALRYNDVLDCYTNFRNYLWQKIFGYYTGVLGLKGFKKSILSLKMKPISCLMATFIDGMETTLEQQKAVLIHIHPYKEQYGLSIMVKFLKNIMFIIRMGIERIILLKTLRLLVPVSIQDSTAKIQMGMHNQKYVSRDLESLMIKLKNGIEVKKGVNGIETMPKKVCQLLEELDIKRCVAFAKKNLKVILRTKDSAITRAKINGVLSLKRILSKDPVAFAKLYLAVTNILLKKHAVRDVRFYQKDTPQEVYDITIEDDNCYYANDYLVSNCDALRMACISLNLLNEGMTPEDLNRIKNKARYPDQSLQGFNVNQWVKNIF